MNDMQDLVVIAGIMRNISIGVLIAGLFYTFGMFVLGRVFAIVSDHDIGHDIDHDIDHDISHDIDHDIDHDISHDIDHDIDHDISHDIDHDIDHDISHDIDHDIDHDISHDIDHDIDHDISHDIDHDIDHDISHDIDHDIDHDADHGAHHDMSHDTDIAHEVDVDSHSGFFEFSQNTPFGVTIGTSLVSFGFLGTIIYYPGIEVSLFIKLALHFLSVAVVVYSVRGVLGRVFIESGFNITPRHLVGKEVTAVSTISDGFGEVRTITEMGPRRFHARPFIKGTMYKKGDDLWVISANDRFVYVDSSKDAKKWTQEQSKTEEPTQ